MVIIRVLLFFIIIPILTGITVSYKITPFSIVKAFPIGYITIWALMEIISIPVTIFKLPFTLDVAIVVTGALIMSVIALFIIVKNNTYKKGLSRLKASLNNYDISDYLFILLFVAALIYMIYKMVTVVFYDDDDSRFVVEAIDIIKDNRILASDPVTGLPLTSNFDDFHKDLVSEWAVFLAMGGFLAGVSPTVFAHSVYPIIALILLICLIFMILEQSLNSAEVSTIFPALTFLQVVITYGFYTLQSSERFILSRVWQGKASLAGIGITSIILAFLYINKRYTDNKNLSTKALLPGFAFLLLCNIAMCFMSSMGVVLGATIIAGYGIVTAASARSVKILFFSGFCCAPNIILFALDRLYTIDIYLGIGT